MSKQNAVLLSEVGKPLALGSRQIPTPAPGQVKVKVTSTMLLPHDSYSREFGLFVGEKLPWVLGANVAGEVTELGPGVSKVKIGDHVFGLENIAAGVPDGGGLQEYAL